MSILKIVLFPDENLQKPTRKVEVFDINLQIEIDNMFESMYHYQGIGLAANQVGIDKSMFIMDITSRHNQNETFADKKYCFINPEILYKSEEKSEYEEGCLSVPEQKAFIDRPSVVRLKYQDIAGKYHEIEANGLAATCIQHEVDHLNGVIFIDRVKSQMKKSMMKKKAKRIKDTSY